MPRYRSTALAATAALALLVGACGGGGGDDDGDDVATLGSDPAATDDTAPGDEPTQDPEEAALEYAQCMRDHGIDMPDPSESGGGMVIMQDEGEGDGPSLDSEEWQAAQEECQPIMDAAISGMEGPSEEELAEMQDQALAAAQCMRDHGYEEWPDPQFEDNGAMAQRLPQGIDPEDPEFQDTQEACMGGPGMVFGTGPDGERAEPGGGPVVSGGPVAGSSTGGGR